MKNLLTWGLLGTLIAGCGSSAGLSPWAGPDGQGATALATVPTDDYFPMVAGDQWDYEETLLSTTGNQRKARFNSTWSDVSTAGDRTTGTQVMANTATDSYPPVRIPYVKTATEVDLQGQASASVEMLAMPMSVGTAWDPKVSFGSLGQPHMVVAAAEDVTVPAGTFHCLRVDMSFQGKVSTRTWYAPGVGEVKDVSLGQNGNMIESTDLLDFHPAAGTAVAPWSVEMAMAATDGTYTVLSFQLGTGAGESQLNIRLNSANPKDLEVWQDGKMVPQPSFGSLADQLAQAQLGSPGYAATVQQAIAALRQ